MGVSQKVLNAAINGPQVNEVKICEINGSKEHEFNVKPVSISVLSNGDMLIFGQISHCLKLRVDDQHWFGFKKRGSVITPSDPFKMILEKENGGVIATLSKLKDIASFVGAIFGYENIGSYFDKLEANKDKLSFLSMENGYEKAIMNFLNELSKSIQPLPPLTQTGLVLFEHDNFRGKKMLVGVNENITHLKSSSFNDRASSLQVLVPNGTKLEVFKDESYTGDKIEFSSGSHFIRDLKIHKLGDELTSCRWTKVTLAIPTDSQVRRVVRA